MRFCFGGSKRATVHMETVVKLNELRFREYYHQYVVLEADELTERFKKQIRIGEEDCYMLCSSFISSKGRLLFNVLSAGSTWTTCTKGLGLPEMLGVFSPCRLGGLNARRVQPSDRVRQKNLSFLRTAEKSATFNLWETRRETRLDPLRDDYYPDVMPAGILSSRGIREYPMRAQSFDGPFLVGRLLEKTGDPRYPDGELLYTMPYPLGQGMRLLTVFHGDTLSKEDEKNRAQIKREAQDINYGFCDGGFRAKGVLQ
jgi:hypothetical protein